MREVYGKHSKSLSELRDATQTCKRRRFSIESPNARSILHLDVDRHLPPLWITYQTVFGWLFVPMII
jgi:hypothetical protein